jgi:DNA-binding HxlR family transcriptional regulator
MARRSYAQYCSLARALDIVGERWTLLILRELMIGPRRFSQLVDALPGIGKNLLSARLRHLQDEGLVTPTEATEAGRSAYELTTDGRSLGPALGELSRWGVQRLGPPTPQHTFRPAWAMFPLNYMADRSAARGIDETYEFRIDAETFHLRVADGDIESRSGPAPAPDLVLTLDGSTMLELLADELDPLEALSTGRVAFAGDPATLEHCVAILAGR